MNNDPRHLRSHRLLQRASTLRCGFDPRGTKVVHNGETTNCALYPGQRHRQSFACRDPFDRLPCERNRWRCLLSPLISPRIIIKIDVANAIKLIPTNCISHCAKPSIFVSCVIWTVLRTPDNSYENGVPIKLTEIFIWCRFWLTDEKSQRSPSRKIKSFWVTAA